MSGKSNSQFEDLKLEARIACAIYKALTRPEILEYMREQVIRDTIDNLNNLTDEEVENYIKRQVNARTKNS